MTAPAAPRVGLSDAAVDLELFEVAWPVDSVQVNPDLVCTVCMQPLCEVEQGDTVLTYLMFAVAHFEAEHAEQPKRLRVIRGARDAAGFWWWRVVFGTRTEWVPLGDERSFARALEQAFVLADEAQDSELERALAGDAR